MRGGRGSDPLHSASDPILAKGRTRTRTNCRINADLCVIRVYPLDPLYARSTVLAIGQPRQARQPCHIETIKTIETIRPSLPYRDYATTFPLLNPFMLDAGSLWPPGSLKTETRGPPRMPETR